MFFCFSRSASCTNELVIGSSLTSLGGVRVEVHVAARLLCLPSLSFLYLTVSFAPALCLSVAQLNASSDLRAQLRIQRNCTCVRFKFDIENEDKVEFEFEIVIVVIVEYRNSLHVANFVSPNSIAGGFRRRS